MITPAPRPPRLPDWQTRWSALCEQRAAVPFAWGSADCALWAVDAVHAITGVDHAAAEWRGRYSTAAGAARLLARAGGLRGVACNALGDALPPVWAALGDVVLISQPEAPDEHQRELLAVCNGSSAIGQGPDGLLATPMTNAKLAWKV
jgi:hypothetical protein